jgi:hypothetical protein
MNAEIPTEVNGVNLVFLREKSCNWKKGCLVRRKLTLVRTSYYNLIIKFRQNPAKKRGLTFLSALKHSGSLTLFPPPPRGEGKSKGTGN